MKTLFFFFSLCLLFSSLTAQDAELQMYKDELARAVRLKNNDSLAAAYCHLGEYYAYRQADSARYYCEEGLKYANPASKEPYITLLNNLAETYASVGEMDEAIKRQKKTYQEAVRLKSNMEIRATLLTSIGVAYRRKEMPDSALAYYNRALGLLENSTAYDELAHLLTSIAVLYAQTARLAEGEAYARRGLEAARKCEDIDMLLYAGSTAGAILSLHKKYEEAAQMIHPVLAKAREQRKPKFELKSIVYLLNMFYRMNNNDSINYYMRQAETVVKQLPPMSNEVLGYQESLYDILTKMKRYRESLAIQYRLLELKG